jgi:hypothetical protein
MASTERQNALLIGEDWKKIYQTFQNADFKSYDFETIKRSMVEYLRQNYPENFNDYIDSSEYIALIDLVAFLAQSLSFRVDLNARENFIDTAERRDSILKLAKLISYSPKRTQTSVGLLKVTSVSTTENVIDAAGTNLSNKIISWNDGTNQDWYQQFTLVMNSAMSTAIFGKPNSRRTINGILTEQYNLGSVTSDVPIFSFTKNVAGFPMSFEIVSSNIIDTDTISETSPKLGGEFGVIYKNDNKGSASKNSGWFLQFKEGALSSADFTVNNAVSNEIIGIDVENINETDVWLYQLNVDNTLGTLWTKLDSVSGNNAIYTNLKNKIKTFYSVSSRENDQIDLHFSDGVFGRVPNGDFRIYYRTSNGLSYSISPQEMSDVQVRIPYISKNGQINTVSMTLSLQASVNSSASSESNSSIRENAPQVYYTQNRMITGEDYNILPLSFSQDIIKIKSVNRISSGISRYFEINDPTGRSSSVDLYADDGALYFNSYTNSFIFTFDTKNEVFGLVKTKIEPLISTEAMRDFYYRNFERIAIGNLGVAWYNISSEPNQSTGYFKSNTTQSAVPVGQFTQSALRYVKAEALIKFVPPTGKYFSPSNLITNTKTKNTKDYIWTKIIYQSGDGSNLGTGTDETGIGLIGITNQVPTGAVPSQIIPLFVTDIPFSFESEIANQLFLRRDFGIRYDRDVAEWKIINLSNLDLTSEFSLTYSGDISNLGLDASWLVSFQTDGDNYIVRYRGLDYIFQSERKINFYFNDEDKRYNKKLGGTSKDNIVILSINDKVSDGTPLGQSYQFEITGMFSNLDGYKDNNRIKISFSDKTGDGIVDDPDSFDNVTEPTTIDPDSNTIRSFVFLESLQLEGTVVKNIFDNSQILTFENELDLQDLNSYDIGQLFYFYSPTENIVKRLDDSRSLVVVNSIEAFPGRDSLAFQYKHQASQDYRIDPAKSNIIDVYLLTKTYDDSVRTWVLNQEGDPPPAPTSLELFETYGSKLSSVKSISDEVVFHTAKYKLLFGNGAEQDLQAQFYIVKNPSSITNDNDIKVRVIESMNEFFSLQNWDFGDTFNFGELSAYVIKELSPDVVNFLIVPTSPEKYFGSLFQVFCQPDEIFLSTASVENLEIINTVTSGLLKTNGPIVVSSN